MSVQSVAKHFKLRSGQQFVAVDDVSMDVAEGEVVCVVGSTGCGKSTLLTMLLGLEPPTSGRIEVLGLSPVEDFRALRRKVAAVFQTDRLLPWCSVLDNAAMGLELAGIDRDERYETARQWLDRVGLAGWEHAYPDHLSGGMRQRVSLARAFVVNPALVLLDEAFGHLDEVTAESLRRDCMALLNQEGSAAVVITHNISEALDIAHRIVVLSKPARVIADMRLDDLDERDVDSVKRDIFSMIQQGDSALDQRVSG